MPKPITSAEIRRFGQSIPKAREEVELAARFYINAGPYQPDWESHKVFVAFAYYLARLDYEYKVLLHQFFSDEANRAVWEGQLAVLIDGTLIHLQKGLGQLIKDLERPDTVSHLDVESVKKGARAFSETRKKIESDKNFMSMLKLVRNGVVAHHGFDKGKTAEEAIAWTYSSIQSRARGYRAQDSQVAEYAVRIGRAVQDLGGVLHS